MKKIFIMLMILLCLNIDVTVSANDEQHYIVKLKSSIVTLFSNTDEFVSLGDDLYRVDSIDTINKYFSKEDIASIFPDCELELFEASYPQITSDENFSEQWYLDVIGATASRTNGIFGDGIKIAIIDSGLTTAHSDLKAKNILQGYNCITNANDIYDTNDYYGHGTKVTGIISAQTDNQIGIAGIASNAQIIPLKVTNGHTLSLSSVFLAINKAIELDCDIINMSLGGYISNEETIKEFKNIIDKAVSNDIIIVAAVGNGGTEINYPAGFDNVIGVGAVNEDISVSSTSQHNETVFVTAPGENILSLSNTNSIESDTGTSFATPQVTAIIALIKELCPYYTINDIKSLLMETSDDLGISGYDIYYGHGLVNLENILVNLSDYIPEFAVSQGMGNNTARIHIYNNSFNDVIADCFFVSYSDERLKDLELFEKSISKGVTSIEYNNKFSVFLIWDKNMKPYVKKYILD